MQWGAAGFLLELRATQEFLQASARCAPSTAQQATEAQAAAILSKLTLVPGLSLKDASGVLETLRQGPWSPAQLEAFACKVSNLAAQPEAAAARRPASIVQSLLCPEALLTEGDWQELQQPGSMRAKMTRLASALLLLGLRWPSERSVQSVVALLLVASEGFEATMLLAPVTKLAFVQDFKGLFRTLRGL